jgi:hypothetical protein
VPRRFTLWGATLSKPVFHACNLLGSLRKEIIQTFLLTEVIAPPTMTDETELTIAGVTSLHEFPRGMAAKVDSLPESSRNGPAGEAKAANSLIV